LSAACPILAPLAEKSRKTDKKYLPLSRKRQPQGVEFADWSVFQDINLSDQAFVSFNNDPPPVASLHGCLHLDFLASSYPGWTLKEIDFELFYDFVNVING